MKVVFPCKGVIVLTKNDIETLENFYNTTLVTSKVYEIYNTSEYMMQIGNLNYLPKKTTLVLDESKLLTIPKLRSILNNSTPTKSEKDADSQNKYNETQVSEDEAISDDSILSHPFFQTLKPLD